MQVEVQLILITRLYTVGCTAMRKIKMAITIRKLRLIVQQISDELKVRERAAFLRFTTVQLLAFVVATGQGRHLAPPPGSPGASGRRPEGGRWVGKGTPSRITPLGEPHLAPSPSLQRGLSLQVWGFLPEMGRQLLALWGELGTGRGALTVLPGLGGAPCRGTGVSSLPSPPALWPRPHDPLSACSWGPQIPQPRRPTQSSLFRGS